MTAVRAPAEAPLWSLPTDEACSRLDTAAAGLTDVEAARRLRRDGPNELPDVRARPLALRLLAQLTHLMAILLWVAGALAFVAGTPELGWAIWAVIWINAGFSFWQEYRAERALAALRGALPAEARTRRGGVTRLLPARELVSGDVVELEEGDRVSADARLLTATALRLDLSILNGESAAVPRTAEPVLAPGPPTPETANLVYAGTSVVAGRGCAVVYATGTRTSFGRVAALTASIERQPSTLEIQVGRLVRVISLISIAIGLAVFLSVRLLVGLELWASIALAIGIIVANVPEGLLPTVTLSLAMGVQRMARRRVLVRRLSAIETLSATTVICTDKTGTLTRNEMTVHAVWVPEAMVGVTGIGYLPEGQLEGPDPDAVRRARLLLGASALCSNARLVPPNGLRGWGVMGDPMEGALLVAAAKAALSPSELAARAERLREVPFDSWRKMMTCVVRWDLGALWPGAAHHVAVTKGAPLEVLARSRFLLHAAGPAPIGAAERASVLAANDALARQGYRVLAVALRPGAVDLAGLPAVGLERELVLLGLVAIADPPRPEVRSAIELCRRAGIRVTMVTGDYGLTAEAIGREVGLLTGPGDVLTGVELDARSDAQLAELLRGETELIFARLMPEQKLRLVRAYQALGHVVAVTGDGVNDAPALHAADVGIAMGLSGTDVARGAADIVLADDNFATIVNAIEEGRAVYANIRKFLTYVMASNVAEMTPFVAMVAVRIPPALTIMQILAIDLGTDMVPALALGGERAEPGLMTQPPRPKERPLLDLGLFLRVYTFIGLLESAFSMSAFALVWWLHGYGLTDLQQVAAAVMDRSAAPAVMQVYRVAMTTTLVAIVAGQVGAVLACRSEHRSLFGLGLNSNPLIWLGVGFELALIVAIVYAPPLQRVFTTVALDPRWWPLLLLAAPFVLAADEIRKLVVRKVRT